MPAFCRKPSLLLVFAVLVVGLVVAAGSYRHELTWGEGEIPVSGLSPSGLALTDALILGVVEGTTEYLPVSSTGHLLLAQRLLGLGGHATARRAADAYAIVIQLGAILAVISLYRHRMGQMFAGLAGGNPGGRRLLTNLILAFLPAAAFGLLFGRHVKTHLFHPLPIVIAWLAGGVAILLLTRWRAQKSAVQGLELGEVNSRQAILIGIAQSIALWPGVSRSLVTIASGLLLGLRLPAAVEFSFLLGLVTLTAATSWEFLQEGHVLVSVYGWSGLAAGFLAAFVSAILAVRWMVAFLGWRELNYFGYYRLLLASAAGALILCEVI